MPDRRFPPLWTIEENNDACFIVRDKIDRPPRLFKGPLSVNGYRTWIYVGLFAVPLALIACLGGKPASPDNDAPPLPAALGDRRLFIVRDTNGRARCPAMPPAGQAVW